MTSIGAYVASDSSTLTFGVYRSNVGRVPSSCEFELLAEWETEEVKEKGWKEVRKHETRGKTHNSKLLIC